MPNRFIRRLGLWMSVFLLAAATGSVMAEAPVRAELLARHRPTAHAVRRTAHQRPGRLAHFFRGILIGLAILMPIWLVIG